MGANRGVFSIGILTYFPEHAHEVVREADEIKRSCCSGRLSATCARFKRKQTLRRPMSLTARRGRYVLEGIYGSTSEFSTVSGCLAGSVAEKTTTAFNSQRQGRPTSKMSRDAVSAAGLQTVKNAHKVTPRRCAPQKAAHIW